jgi:hypothetical protein
MDKQMTDNELRMFKIAVYGMVTLVFGLSGLIAIAAAALRY